MILTSSQFAVLSPSQNDRLRWPSIGPQAASEAVSGPKKRSVLFRQSIHLFDPLDHAAASAPVIMLHFGTCNDERAISDCEMSRRSQDSAECVPLEPPLDSHLLTEGTEQAAKERHASTSFNQPGEHSLEVVLAWHKIPQS